MELLIDIIYKIIVIQFNSLIKWKEILENLIRYYSKFIVKYVLAAKKF